MADKATVLFMVTVAEFNLLNHRFSLFYPHINSVPVLDEKSGYWSLITSAVSGVGNVSVTLEIMGDRGAGGEGEEGCWYPKYKENIESWSWNPHFLGILYVGEKPS